MSPSTVKERTEVISVVCCMSLAEMPQDVKALEERIVEKVRMSGREFYALCFGAMQQRWLQEHRRDHTAVRWRTIDQLTPFGLIRLPVRVVRERGKTQGGYFTLSKTLLKPKATRLLSPWVEKRALRSGHLPQLSPCGGRALALVASAGERMVDLEMRAVPWGTSVRATGSGLVAGSSQGCASQSGGYGNRFHLSQAPTTWTSQRWAGRAFSNALGIALQRARAALPKAWLPFGATAK